jgi:hypothetical protein
MKTFMLMFILAVFVLTPPSYGQRLNNEKRLALVIGNGKYVYCNELSNPTNDSKGMKAALQKVGFDVLEYENLNQAQMKKAIDEFGVKLKNYSVGLFFYAGHGIQSKGYNYLIPVDANIQSEQQVEYDCVQADRVLGLMEEAGSPVNIVILDACRNNPFGRSWSRAANNGGLAFMNAPSGSLIAYATSPGRTASDGSGSNGLYTSALLENLQTPGISVLQMFQNVRRTVSQKSYKMQIPWESTSLTGDFFFVNSPKTDITNSAVDNTTGSNATTTNANKSSVATWKLQNGNYWFYFKGQEIGARLKSVWSNNDLLVYDSINNVTCLLKDYKTRPEGQMFDADILGNVENTFWRRSEENLFWLYCKGYDIQSRTTSTWIDNDVLVYDAKTNITYLLKEYKSKTDNQLRPAFLFDNAESVFWRKQDNSYWLYAKGENIQSRTKSGWVDDDLLVFDVKTNTTYLLKDFNKQTDLQLQPAKVVSYIDNVFWRKKDGYYYLYVKGEQIASRTTSAWNGADLMVTDTTTKTKYVLVDYNNAQENVLRPLLK